MTSDRGRRRIERLLDEADEAADRRDWDLVRQRAEDVLAFDPENADAKDFLLAASRSRTQATMPAPGPPTPVPSPDQPSSFANGRYVVTKFLGEGGKKKVYLARDARLDRDVAFALIKTDGLDEASRVRVQREAEAMGRLGAHPHIVTVFDIGEEEGQPYLVLPVLAGGDVEGVIESAPENKLPIERAVKIAVDTCLGLEFAHAKGIVHRDLKPGNVWLTEDGRAMIGDFGLAVAVDKSRLTQAGMMVGTVNYMPPEQAMGGQVGPRSDLYSLGAMLYEMVCGRPPFVGDESVAIIGQHLNTPPVAPSWHRPDCPLALEALILRLLEKDPTKRPASAEEVRLALEGIGTAARPRDPTVAAELPSGGDNPLYRRTFVGRENEVRQLQQAFDAALSGEGGLVMVVGEPGIGKTALCEQLATYVTLRGGKALVGHCYEEGSLSLPYLAFVEAMRTYVLARDPDGLRSELGTGAADVARIVSEVRDRVQGVELRPSGDPEDDRWRLLQAVTSFLRNASTVQPLCIVLEDLHWADRGTLDLLLHISRNVQGARLLVVGTYRDVEVDRSHPLSNALGDLRRINTFLRVPLRGLTAEEVQRMMAGVARQDIPWPFAELLHRQTEGNPLFVQEMLRFLVEEGLVAERQGTLARVGEESLAGRIPEGLRDVIGRRLSRLSAECNRVLSIASVIGRDFRLDTLTTVSGLDEESLVTALEDATRIGVLEEQARAGTVGYRFTHAFFRQTLYEELSAPRRIRMHQQVARALEKVYSRRLEEHAPELAEHFSHSSDPEDLTSAVSYGDLAAKRAMSVFDYGEAVRLLERAIDVQEVLDPDDKAKRCDLLLALGEALMPCGEPLRAAEEMAEEAFVIAESLHDRGRAGRAVRLALEAMNRYGAATAIRTSTFRRLIERAKSYAEPGSALQVVTLCYEAAANSRDDADYAAGLRHQALEIARRIGDKEVLFFAGWRAMAAVTTDPETHKTSLHLAEEFSNHSREGIRPVTASWTLWRSGLTFLDAGRRSEAEACWQQLHELAQNTRDADTRLRPLGTEFVLAILDGDLSKGVETAHRMIVLSDELGAPVTGRQFARLYASQPLLLLGRWAEVIELAATELAGGVEQETARTIARRALGLKRLGEIEAAQKSLEDAFARLGRSVPDDSIVTLEAAVELNDTAKSETLLRVCAGMAGGYFSGSIICPARILGSAARLLNEHAAARQYYEQGLQVCEAIRFRPELALLHLELAELLLDDYPDEHDAAIEHLDFAIAELRDMKMQPALERALRHRGLLKA